MRLDAKTEGKSDSDDDDPDSRVNLTVEGYFPPTPSSPTPPPTPVSESGVAADSKFVSLSSIKLIIILCSVAFPNYK